MYARNGKRAKKGKFGDCLPLFKYVTHIWTYDGIEIDNGTYVYAFSLHVTV